MKANLKVINELNPEEEKGLERQKIYIEASLYLSSSSKIFPEFKYSYFVSYECPMKGEEERNEKCNQFVENYYAAYNELEEIIEKPKKLETFINNLFEISVLAIAINDEKQQ